MTNRVGASLAPFIRHGTASRDWMIRAACRGTKTDPNNDIFFPTAPPGRGGEHQRRIDTARARKMFCGHCPVRPDCYLYAIALDIRFGIWGGINEHDRPNGGTA